MMDHQEATASLDLFSEELVNLCTIYNVQIEMEHAKTKDELIEKLIGRLKQVKRDASVVHLMVSKAIGYQHEKLLGNSMDGTIKLFESLNRNILALGQAEQVLRKHEEPASAENTPERVRFIVRDM
jgi:hypothetical protein